MKRIFWIVLDSAGIGEAPDADKFGDVGSNTWKSCYNSGKLHIPNMEKIGIYQIDGMGYDNRTLGNGGNRNTRSTSQISKWISKSIHRGIFKKDGKKDSM